MVPVHEFKANFDVDATNTATEPDCEETALVTHDTDSSVRNVCFVWQDGRRAFFNYAYLVSVDLLPTDSVNVLLLYFSGQIVTLKGYQLELLFDLLLNHIPKTITAHNPRYYIDGQTQNGFIVDIKVKSE